MDTVYLSSYSFGRFIPLFMSVIITIFFLGRKNRSKPTLFLGLYFFFVALFNVGYFIALSFFSSHGAIGWFIAGLSVFGLVFLIQFAYHISENPYERESKIIFVISLIIAFLAYGDYVFVAYNKPIVLNETGYAHDYRSNYIPVVIMIFYLWTLFVFIRKVLHLSEKKKKGLFKIKTFFSPGNREGRLCRNFTFLVILDSFSSSLVVMFTLFDSFTKNQINLIMNLAILLTCFFYMIVYVNHSPEPVSFMVKLISIFYATTLVVITVLGSISLAYGEKNFKENCDLISNYIIMNNDLKLQRNCEIYYVLKKDGNKREIIYRNNLLSINVKYQDFIGEKKYIFSGSHPFIIYNKRNGNSFYQYAISYIAFKKALHDQSRTFIYATLIIAFFVMVLFRVIFYTGIINPLHNLIKGFNDITTGTLEVEVPVHSEDEIGKISQSFNALIASIRERQDHIHRNALLENEAKEKEKDYISDSSAQKVQTAIEYIKVNYMYDISREGLGALVDLSPGRLGKAFKTYTGNKISDYINELRIKEAMIHLKKGDAPIIDIAYSVGFESLSTFNRAFVKNTGISPSVFRKDQQFDIAD